MGGGGRMKLPKKYGNPDEYANALLLKDDPPRLAAAVVVLREKMQALVDNLAEGDFISLTRLDEARKALADTEEWAE